MNGLAVILALVLLVAALPAHGALLDRVNEAFRSVYGRPPAPDEWARWAARVQRGEKKTYEALAGAMGYQKARPQVLGAVTVAPQVAGAAKFATDKKYYPSTAGPNFLPDGVLITAPGHANVYYVRGGKKSWIIPGVLNKWLGENHYFGREIIISVSKEDFARYPQTSSVNPAYEGKILIHPNGTQYFIDDKLRKREMPGSVRSALKVPGGNAYPTSAAHLQEFKTGPKLSAASYPGGMVVYTGPYHGGRFWKMREGKDGKIYKHLYLSDYIYEADFNPDESHRAPAIDAMLAKHPRGTNIERYPDGWPIGIGSSIYVTRGGQARLITTPKLFDALGYTSRRVRKDSPEYLARYPKGEPIRAFKGIVASGSAASRGAPAPAPNSAHDLHKVRPAIRTLIARVNEFYQLAYDSDVSTSENKFWVDYVYNGEVTTREDLLAAMRRAKKTGKKPPRTSRAGALDESVLESHWLPYLFYFVHQSEPSEDDNDYWYDRIKQGDRETIEGLGGTLQWVKDNLGGATRR